MLNEQEGDVWVFVIKFMIEKYFVVYKIYVTIIITWSFVGEALGGGGQISSAVLPQALIGEEGVKMLETSHEILTRGD